MILDATIANLTRIGWHSLHESSASENFSNSHWVLFDADPATAMSWIASGSNVLQALQQCFFCSSGRCECG